MIAAQRKPRCFCRSLKQIAPIARYNDESAAVAAQLSERRIEFGADPNLPEHSNAHSKRTLPNPIMESYKIIRNSADKCYQYDFTLQNGINIKVDFVSETRANGRTDKHLRNMEVYDSDRNNITDYVVSAYQLRAGAMRFEPSPSAELSAMSHADVHQLINWCKALPEEELESARLQLLNQRRRNLAAS